MENIGTDRCEHFPPKNDILRKLFPRLSVKSRGRPLWKKRESFTPIFQNGMCHHGVDE